MKSKALFLLFLLVCIGGFSQTKDDLKKQNKGLIKTLKDKYELKKVELCLEHDGFWYFSLTNKQKEQGIAEKNGEIIIPIEKQKISYIPALTEAYENVLIPGAYGVAPKNVTIYHKASPAIFMTQNNSIGNTYSLYDTSGKIKRANIDNITNYFSGYFVLGAEYFWYSQDNNGLYINARNDNNMHVGLITADGEDILKPEYYCFQIKQKNEIVYKTRVFYWKKSADENGVGALFLEEPQNQTPSIFSTISIRKEDLKFLVKRGIDTLEVYNPIKKDYANVTYADKGEELFQKSQYEDVISFYSKGDVNNAQAKVYTGISLINLARGHVARANILTNAVKITTATKLKFEPYDLDLAIEQYQMGMKSLEMALEQDSTLEKTIVEEYQMANKEFKALPEIKAQNDQAVEILNQRYEKELAQQRAAQAIATIVMKGMMSGLQESFKTGNSTKNYTPSHTGNKSVDNPQNNSTSNSGSNENITERIRQLERNIRQEQEYLDKAQERYSNNPSATGRSAVEAHKRAIEGYKQQIEELQRN